MKKNDNQDWLKISEKAWEIRENAHIYGKIKVGSAIVSEHGNIFSGCNIEHMYRSHDVHAEVNAISSLIASNDRKIKKIIIVATEDFFTPCGSCMDWIMQFSDDDTIVGVQREKGGEIKKFKPSELMPFYPR